MARETNDEKQSRATAIFQVLGQTYPEAHCELRYSNPLELLVATILSAQCTDKQVNIVTEVLFDCYRTARDYAEVPLPTLEHDIRRIGLFRNKARNIQTTCRMLVTQHQGEVPQTMEALTALAGVGRKTANVVLGNAFGIQVGVVVDTHVSRLAQRLVLTRETSPEKIELALMKLTPRDQWALLSHWLIWHGRRRCNARSPQCGECEIQALCPTGAKDRSSLSENKKAR